MKKEVREFFERQVEEKRSQLENLQNAMIESEDKEERAKLGETLTKVRSELEEAEKILEGTKEDGDGEGDGDGTGEGDGEAAKQRSMLMMGTYAMSSGIPGEDFEAREKKMNEQLEKRGKDLREKRAVQVSSSNLVLPKHTGNMLNDTFTPVSTLVDQVKGDNLNGGESYEEAYVVSYGTGGITEEANEYEEAEPTFNYAPINKIKVTAYAEISEEVKKLPNIDYARKVQEACEIALKKKLSQQILHGTGTKQLTGIFANPVAINASKDVELEAIDINTLNTAVFSYGGDEDVETQAVIILNKKTLKELSEVKKANGDPAYDIDLTKKTINTIPYTINSNVKDFETATAGEFVMAYGDLNAYKMSTFSPVEIMESSDYRFKQGMICFRASVFVGGNVVKQDGFLRLKKKTA